MLPWDAKIGNLSGGEKRRVALCRLLLSKPDMLLLDEPTNHLDAESVEWLEQFLQRYPGTVVAVTADIQGSCDSGYPFFQDRKQLGTNDATLLRDSGSYDMKGAAAACMAGDDPERIARLPDTTGMPNEIVIQRCQRIQYDQALRTAGARLVEVGGAEACAPHEVAAAIGQRTAALVFIVSPRLGDRGVPVDRMAEIARRARGFLYTVSATGTTGERAAVEGSRDGPSVEQLHGVGQAREVLRRGLHRPGQCVDDADAPTAPRALLTREDTASMNAGSSHHAPATVTLGAPEPMESRAASIARR